MKDAGLLTVAPRAIKATGQLIVSSLHTYNVGLPAVQDCMEMSLSYIAPCKDIPAPPHDPALYAEVHPPWSNNQRPSTRRVP